MTVYPIAPVIHKRLDIWISTGAKRAEVIMKTDDLKMNPRFRHNFVPNLVMIGMN